LPLEAFSGAKWGAVDVLFDKNVVSKVPLFLELPERKVEPLALATYRSYLGDVQTGGIFQNDEYVVNPLRKIPTNSEGTALIPFFREPKEFPAYSLSDVLSGKIPNGTFKDKAVLVGEYGTLIHDSHFSPVDFGTKMPGVEFHANFLEGLFSGQFLRPLSKIETVASFMIAAFVSSAVFTYARIGVSATYAVAFLAVSLFSGWYLLAFHGVVISYFALAFSGVFIPLPVSYVYRYFVVNRDRHLIEAAFSHYIAPEVVSAIADDPKSLKLGGEKREVTVFFSDIAGFTTISEALGTERLFALISEYLSQMTEILIHNKGTLDKYIGDAVMGFFGAPLRLENPEILACKTALEQHSRLRMLQTRWKKEGIPPVLARIGIHSGEAMVGNIGSKNRFNYTAMGDTVNLASRLEGVNKEYGTFICVSESVAKKASKEFVFRELDTIKVKGKTEGVKIFELMGFSDDPYLDRAKIAAYQEALVPYYAGEFSKARKAFGKISNDSPSDVMAHRCKSLEKGETVLENGVFSMKTK
jgi:adenylate cyclase